MSHLTARSSTIFITTGDQTRVYRSVDEVPPALRRKLVQFTRGMNSATILIADKRGREELARALQGRPSEVQCRLVDTIRSRQTEQEQPKPNPPGLRIRTWLELLLPIAVGASLWFLIDSHF